MSNASPANSKLRLAMTGVTTLVGQALLEALAGQRDVQLFVVEEDEVDESYLDVGHVSEQLTPDELAAANCSALLLACEQPPAWADHCACPLLPLWPAAGLDRALVTALEPLWQQLDGKLQALAVTVLWPMATRQQPGIEELVQQSASLLNGRGATPKLFPQQVAFNLSLGGGNGQPLAERLQLPVTWLEATAPLFFVTSLSLSLTSHEPLTLSQWRELICAAGISLPAPKRNRLSLVDEVSGQSGWHGTGLTVSGRQASLWLAGDLAHALLVEPALAIWRAGLAAR